MLNRPVNKLYPAELINMNKPTMEHKFVSDKDIPEVLHKTRSCSYLNNVASQPAFTCLKLTIETLEQAVKHVRS